MTPRIVEAAQRLIDAPNLHAVTRTFPDLTSMLVDKLNWWNGSVHTFAREDEYKTVAEILALGWAEKKEADEAIGWSKLVELGDIGVFLAAGMPRELLCDAHENLQIAKIANKQSLYLAHYMFDELAKLDIPNAYEEMRKAVFEKIKNNFPTQLNPPLPEKASRESVGLIYKTSYSTSRNLRTFAKLEKCLDISDTGLPKNWSTVYYTNESTLDDLLDVKQKTLEQMIIVATAYKQAFGVDQMTILIKHWETSAPGMIASLQKYLS